MPARWKKARSGKSAVNEKRTKKAGDEPAFFLWVHHFSMKLPLDNFRSPAALSRFFLTMLLGLALDLGTKQWAFERLSDGVCINPVSGRAQVISPQVHQFIPGWLHFTVTVNEGAVFGKGQGLRWLFLTMSILAILFLTGLFAASGRQRWYQFTLGLLLAGVLGNMYDRIIFGYVRDMIHALPGWRNPVPWLYGTEEIFPWVFNVADCMLCVGVGIMLLHSLVHRPSAARGRDAGARTGS